MRKCNWLLWILLGAALPVLAQHQHDPAQHKPASKPPDGRVAVRFPEQLREHTLANMRDHLLALAQVQEALSGNAFDTAGRIAEERLGMSSLKLHGAHEVAKYMPKGMQEAGAAMHRSASQFALEAQNASVTGDPKPALAALARTTQTCVACHATYRLR
jgi:hypothetical protein